MNQQRPTRLCWLRADSVLEVSRFWRDPHITILSETNVGSRVAAESSRAIGTRGAMEVYGKLLQEGLPVYVPITYTGHDCIVKSRNGGHADIEIKTRSRDAHPYYAVQNFEVRDDFFIICHTLESDDFWVLPSGVYEEHSTAQKNGQLLVLSDPKRKKLNQYRGAFYLLRDLGACTKPVRRRAARGKSMRAEIAKLVLTGMSDGEIARKLSVPNGSVYVVRKKRGPDPHKPFSSGRDRTREELEKIASEG